ncbi:hypothetical protein [Slackia piriformis]|uniref:hypothetical protein n=1 Tax=Slackia piriformis TaxID=626934 RepID=UPI0026DC9103|nr:hypothetical protein [Slackia piriformis]MDO5024676.1 hypothetical protein [Slackia piriformis]
MRKFLITLCAFMLMGAVPFGIISCAASPEVVSVGPLEPSTPCPATSCASGQCHSFDDVPDPDGIHEMVCPEAGCESLECHAWDTLVGRYHQASDASLNVWVVVPVGLALGLILLVKRI